MPKVVFSFVLAALFPLDLAKADGQSDTVTTESVASAARSQREQTPADVAALIAALDSARFADREQAHKSLVEAGSAAIKLLQDVAIAGSPEQATRAVEILSKIAAFGDADAGLAAAQALEELVESKKAKTLNQAAATLETNRRAFQPRVLEEIRQLGGKAELGFNPQTGQQTDVQVVLNEEWKGEDQAVSLLKRLPGLKSLSLQGADLSDDAVQHLKLLKSLSSLQIFGTKITDTGFTELQQSLTSTQVSRRVGAYLGVGGYSGSGLGGGGCTVTSVLPKSAAAKAGLREQDVIVQFGDTRVDNFEQLQKLVGERKAGEEVKLEVLRENQVMAKTVVLLEWK